MSDLYSPAELIQTVNAEDIQWQINSLFINLFFKRVVTFETRDIALDIIDDPDIPMAAFCSPMVGSKVSRDEGYESKVIRPGYMKPKSSIDPNKIAVRQLGVSPEQFNAYSSRNFKIKRAMVRQAQAIRARIEWLAVQAITTGKNIIEGDGIERYELDWNIKPQNIITQSGGTEWSGRDLSTFDPNDDIEEYAEISEGTTNIIVMGRNVWKKYRAFKAVKDCLDTRRGSNSVLETALKNLGDSVSFKGYVGDVAIVVYSGRYTDEDGTEKYFLDPDLMVLGNTSLQGIVAYGGIQDPELIRMGLTKAELAPKNYIVPGDPAIEYVQTHSAPQPIPARINRFVTVRIGLGGAMATHYTELMAGTEALVTTLGIFSANKGVIPAFTPLMQEDATGALVVWDGTSAGKAVYVSAVQIDTATKTQAQVYKTGVLNVDALNWPESVTQLSAKVAAFVGSGISVQPLARV